MIDEYNQKVADFFGLPLANLNIQIVDSREVFNKLLKRKTEDWLVGLTLKGKIYILDKEKFESESIHPKTHFEKVLKHEIAHIYYRNLRGNGHPYWLNEGTAFLVAGQIEKYPKELSLKVLKRYYRGHDKGIYSVGYVMVGEIFKNYGTEKLLELIKIKNSSLLYKELLIMFPWLTKIN